MVKIFENIVDLTESVFQEIISSMENEGKINIALSGGNTPEAMFQMLAKKYSLQIQWNRINFFWVDERCVPHDHPDSNFRMTKISLLDNIQIPSRNVHPINCEKNFQEEIKRCSDEVKSLVPIKNNFPCFDLIFLGVGSDGHTASIFHDQIHLMKSDEIYTLSYHPETKQARFTLTGRVINNSKKIIFVVTGKNKAVVLKNIFSKQVDTRLPAEFIKPADGTLYWFLDKEASSLL